MPNAIIPQKTTARNYLERASEQRREQYDDFCGAIQKTVKSDLSLNGIQPYKVVGDRATYYYIIQKDNLKDSFDTNTHFKRMNSAKKLEIKEDFLNKSSQIFYRLFELYEQNHLTIKEASLLHTKMMNTHAKAEDRQSFPSFFIQNVKDQPPGLQVLFFKKVADDFENTKENETDLHQIYQDVQDTYHSYSDIDKLGFYLPESAYNQLDKDGLATLFTTLESSNQDHLNKQNWFAILDKLNNLEGSDSLLQHFIQESIQYNNDTLKLDLINQLYSKFATIENAQQRINAQKLYRDLTSKNVTLQSCQQLFKADDNNYIDILNYVDSLSTDSQAQDQDPQLAELEQQNQQADYQNLLTVLSSILETENSQHKSQLLQQISDICSSDLHKSAIINYLAQQQSESINDAINEVTKLHKSEENLWGEVFQETCYYQHLQLFGNLATNQIHSLLSKLVDKTQQPKRAPNSVQNFKLIFPELDSSDDINTQRLLFLSIMAVFPNGFDKDPNNTVKNWQSKFKKITKANLLNNLSEDMLTSLAQTIQSYPQKFNEIIKKYRNFTQLDEVQQQSASQLLKTFLSSDNQAPFDRLQTLFTFENDQLKYKSLIKLTQKLSYEQIEDLGQLLVKAIDQDALVTLSSLAPLLDSDPSKIQTINESNNIHQALNELEQQNYQKQITQDNSDFENWLWEQLSHLDHDTLINFYNKIGQATTNNDQLKEDRQFLKGLFDFKEQLTNDALNQLLTLYSTHDNRDWLALNHHLFQSTQDDSIQQAHRHFLNDLANSGDSDQMIKLYNQLATPDHHQLHNRLYEHGLDIHQRASIVHNHLNWSQAFQHNPDEHQQAQLLALLTTNSEPTEYLLNNLDIGQPEVSAHIPTLLNYITHQDNSINDDALTKINHIITDEPQIGQNNAFKTLLTINQLNDTHPLKSHLNDCPINNDQADAFVKRLYVINHLSQSIEQDSISDALDNPENDITKYNQLISDLGDNLQLLDNYLSLQSILKLERSGYQPIKDLLNDPRAINDPVSTINEFINSGKQQRVIASIQNDPALKDGDHKLIDDNFLKELNLEQLHNIDGALNELFYSNYLRDQLQNRPGYSRQALLLIISQQDMTDQTIDQATIDNWLNQIEPVNQLPEDYQPICLNDLLNANTDLDEILNFYNNLNHLEDPDNWALELNNTLQEQNVDYIKRHNWLDTDDHQQLNHPSIVSLYQKFDNDEHQANLLSILKAHSTPEQRQQIDRIAQLYIDTQATEIFANPEAFMTRQDDMLSMGSTPTAPINQNQLNITEIYLSLDHVLQQSSNKDAIKQWLAYKRYIDPIDTNDQNDWLRQLSYLRSDQNLNNDDVKDYTTLDKTFLKTLFHYKNEIGDEAVQTLIGNYKKLMEQIRRLQLTDNWLDLTNSLSNWADRANYLKYLASDSDVNKFNDRVRLSQKAYSKNSLQTFVDIQHTRSANRLSHLLHTREDQNFKTLLHIVNQLRDNSQNVEFNVEYNNPQTSLGQLKLLLDNTNTDDINKIADLILDSHNHDLNIPSVLSILIYDDMKKNLGTLRSNLYQAYQNKNKPTLEQFLQDNHDRCYQALQQQETNSLFQQILSKLYDNNPDDLKMVEDYLNQTDQAMNNATQQIIDQCTASNDQGQLFPNSPDNIKNTLKKLNDNINTKQYIQETLNNTFEKTVEPTSLQDFTNGQLQKIKTHLNNLKNLNTGWLGGQPAARKRFTQNFPDNPEQQKVFLSLMAASSTPKTDKKELQDLVDSWVNQCNNQPTPPPPTPQQQASAAQATAPPAQQGSPGSQSSDRPANSAPRPPGLSSPAPAGQPHHRGGAQPQSGAAARQPRSTANVPPQPHHMQGQFNWQDFENNLEYLLQNDQHSAESTNNGSFKQCQIYADNDANDHIATYAKKQNKVECTDGQAITRDNQNSIHRINLEYDNDNSLELYCNQDRQPDCVQQSQRNTQTQYDYNRIKDVINIALAGGYTALEMTNLDPNQHARDNLASSLPESVQQQNTNNISIRAPLVAYAMAQAAGIKPYGYDRHGKAHYDDPNKDSTTCLNAIAQTYYHQQAKQYRSSEQFTDNVLKPITQQLTRALQQNEFSKAQDTTPQDSPPEQTNHDAGHSPPQNPTNSF